MDIVVVPVDARSMSPLTASSADDAGVDDAMLNVVLVVVLAILKRPTTVEDAWDIIPVVTAVDEEVMGPVTTKLPTTVEDA